MAVKTASIFCKSCQGKRMAQAPSPNHILHLLLTLITFGLWLPIWILVSLFSGGQFHCTHCGNRVSMW